MSQPSSPHAPVPMSAADRAVASPTSSGVVIHVARDTEFINHTKDSEAATPAADTHNVVDQIKSKAVHDSSSSSRDVNHEAPFQGGSLTLKQKWHNLKVRYVTYFALYTIASWYATLALDIVTITKFVYVTQVNYDNLDGVSSVPRDGFRYSFFYANLNVPTVAQTYPDHTTTPFEREQCSVEACQAPGQGCSASEFARFQDIPVTRLQELEAAVYPTGVRNYTCQRYPQFNTASLQSSRTGYALCSYNWTREATLASMYCDPSGDCLQYTELDPPWWDSPIRYAPQAPYYYRATDDLAEAVAQFDDGGLPPAFIRTGASMDQGWSKYNEPPFTCEKAGQRRYCSWQETVQPLCLAQYDASRNLTGVAQIEPGCTPSPTNNCPPVSATPVWTDPQQTLRPRCLCSLTAYLGSRRVQRYKFIESEAPKKIFYAIIVVHAFKTIAFLVLLLIPALRESLLMSFVARNLLSWPLWLLSAATASGSEAFRKNYVYTFDARRELRWTFLDAAVENGPMCYIALSIILLDYDGTHVVDPVPTASFILSSVMVLHLFGSMLWSCCQSLADSKEKIFEEVEIPTIPRD